MLDIGAGVAVPNEKLVAGFDPRADFLGLDALSIAGLVIEGRDPHIDSLCGRDFTAADFGPDGLWRANTATMPPGEPPRRPLRPLRADRWDAPRRPRDVGWRNGPVPGRLGEHDCTWDWRPDRDELAD